MASIVSLDRVSRTYAMDRVEVHALQHVSLEVDLKPVDLNAAGRDSSDWDHYEKKFKGQLVRVNKSVRRMLKLFRAVSKAHAIRRKRSAAGITDRDVFAEEVFDGEFVE
jgi:hypothetical protein